MKYPALFTPETGGFVVTFRDIPEAITQGDTDAEAEAMARDVLVFAMDFYFEDRRPIPPPSEAQPGERLVELPLSVAAKVMLLNQFLASELRSSDLARAMGIKPQEVTRILDLHHPTKIDTLQAAMKALGREFVLAS